MKQIKEVVARLKELDPNLFERTSIIPGNEHELQMKTHS